MFLTMDKLGKRIEQLKHYRYTDFRPIPSYAFWIDEEAAIGAMPPEEADWQPISVGDRWKGWDLTAWLRAEAEIPAEWAGKRIVGLFAFGKTGSGHNSGFESLLYLDGAPYQGVGSNHIEVWFPDDYAGRRADLLFKVWSGLSGADGTRTEQEHQLRQSGLALLETETDDLYYTAFAVFHSIQVLEENRWERQALIKALDRALLLLNWRVPGDAAFYESVREANLRLKAELEQIPAFQPLSIRCIGHTHIDVAWLWRLKHTREKAARSFSTVLRLMEQFPEYVFLQTQPQLYEYIEHDYPEIFAKIKQRVKEGRWEAGGAMWLESDCNIPSGESLVRQLLYGIRYFERTFDAPCEYLWLPDVFGYSWALPQILKKSGLRHFMTTKISWNVYNRFPHDTFYWRGIDGTEVLTHYITTPDPDIKEGTFTRFYTYNGQVLPATLSGIWNNYRDKEINDTELLLSYGYGDGGGGPTRTMLEMRRRLERMPGLPKATTGRADEFFAGLERRVESTDRYVHRWDGELYLELHRGTYTSQAFVKKMNRRLELLLRDAEFVSAAIAPVAGYDAYPAQTLADSWKIVLRNQFHDILPGSSIAEVYEDCQVEYGEAERLAENALSGGLARAARLVRAEGGRWLVFNTLPWRRSELIEAPWTPEYEPLRWLDGAGRDIAATRVRRADGAETLQLLVRDIPALGYTTVCAVAAEANLDAAETGERAAASGVVSCDSGATEADPTAEVKGTTDAKGASGKENSVVAEGAITENAAPEHAGTLDASVASGARVPDSANTAFEPGAAAAARGKKPGVGALPPRPASPAGASEAQLTAFAVSPRGLETAFYALEWNEAGQLSRLLDKRTGREVIAVGETANRFDVHEDKPAYHDNWEIDIFYTQKVAHVTDLRASDLIENGPNRAVVRFEWAYGSTVIRQDMTLYADHPRIDFATFVDWQERETLLKAAFPVTVRAAAATYEIQFGHVQRPTHWNTSWDYARFETCAHKWVDLSERGFGVSLLNDCKYGHDIKDHTMRLTLIKSSNRPDPGCDKGEHTFTYALLPHAGDWFAAGTVEQAHRLNAPVVVTNCAAAGDEISASAEGLPAELGFLAVEGDHVIVDTVKKAEDSDHWIVRCYEYAGKRGEVTFRLPFSIGEVEEVNLLEREASTLAENGDDGRSFRAFFKPFELRTFRLAPQAAAFDRGERV